MISTFNSENTVVLKDIEIASDDEEVEGPVEREPLSNNKKKKKQDSIKMEDGDLDEPHEKVWTIIVDATDPFRIL